MCTCTAAYGVYLVLPLILGALADLYGFSSRQIGWVGAAENLGLLLGSVAVSALAKSGRFRRLMFGGIAIAVAGNAVTMFVQAFDPLAGARFVTGLGSGMAYSAAIACLSLTRNSARHFSVFIVFLVLVNSLELWVVPSIILHWGVAGVYAVLGSLFFVPLLLLRAIPGRVESRPRTGDMYASATSDPVTVPSLAWLCLAAIVSFNVAASAFWAYSERIGASTGMPVNAVANTLTLCNLFSLTGSVLAYWLSLRWGQHRPQLVAVAVMIAVFAMWSVHLTPPGYIAGVLIFFEVWAMTQVYQLGTLNGVDGSGRYIALIPAAQGIGQSAGPFLAGLLLGWKFAFSQMLMTMILFAVGCFTAYLAVYVRLRRMKPRLAA